MTSSAAQAGAISLLEKYSTLNRSMDETRSENTRIHSEKESIRQQIEKLRIERVEMEAQTEQAREDTVTLNKDVQDALAKYAELDDRHAQALLEKMEARRQLQFAKQYVQEQRQEFLDDCRNFRTTCKRMRLTASTVGEDMATSMAFLERHHVNVDWSGCDVNVDDSELEQALADHARRKKERNEAEQVLQAVQARKKISSERAASRLKHKNQSLAQLERLRRDNVDVEKRLKDLDQQTKEAREIAHNYEKDLERRMWASNSGLRGQSYFPAPSVTPNTAPRGSHQSHPYNPYASGARTSSRRTSNSAARQQNSGVGQAWDSNEAQPHLTRRRAYSDRQFGSTALGIISGKEIEEEDAPLPPLGTESNLEPPVYRTIGNNAATTSIMLESDDDDDDIDLLGDPVFSKK